VRCGTTTERFAERSVENLVKKGPLSVRDSVCCTTVDGFVCGSGEAHQETTNTSPLHRAYVSRSGKDYG